MVQITWDGHDIHLSVETDDGVAVKTIQKKELLDPDYDLHKVIKDLKDEIPLSIQKAS